MQLDSVLSLTSFEDLGFQFNRSEVEMKLFLRSRSSFPVAHMDQLLFSLHFEVDDFL